MVQKGSMFTVTPAGFFFLSGISDDFSFRIIRIPSFSSGCFSCIILWGGHGFDGDTRGRCGSHGRVASGFSRR